MAAALKGSDLYTLTGKLLLGYQMDTTLFYQLLGLVQRRRELERPWVFLRKTDASQTANASSTSVWLTAINLPSDFLRWYSPERSVVLSDASNVKFRWYSEVPIERKHEYKDDDTKFYCDYPNGKLYLCGTLDATYTVNQFYIYGTPSVAVATSWTLLNTTPLYDFHPLLAYDVAKEYKDNFDYDIVNAEQARKIEVAAALFMRGMIEWDSALQESQLEGQDYWQRPGGYSGFRSKMVGDNQ